MTTQLLTTFTELEPLAADWSRLAGPAPFRNWSWVAAWWQAFGAGKQLAVWVVRDATGTVVGIAPFYRVTSGVNGLMLRLLGDDLACGDDLSLLIEPGQEPTVLAAIATALLADRQVGKWDQILLEGVTAGNANTLALWSLLAKQGVKTDEFVDQSRWSIKLNPTYQEWYENLGDSTRRLARTCQKKLHDPKAGWKVRQPQSLEECHELFAQVVTLHQLRWRDTEESGSFAKPGFEAFLSQAVEGWFAEGTLRMYVLQQKGVPAAGSISVADGGKLNLYLLGRDPQLDRLQAGWMLNFAIIAEAIDAGFTEVDFLRGDEPYKVRLRAQPIPQVRLQATGAGLVNQLRSLATTGRYAARWVKRRVLRKR